MLIGCGMEVLFSKRAIKFLKKFDSQTAERVRQKILQLHSTLETDRIILFTELDIKKLKGQWESYFRLRVGQIRVIFNLRQQRDQDFAYLRH